MSEDEYMRSLRTDMARLKLKIALTESDNDEAPHADTAADDAQTEPPDAAMQYSDTGQTRALRSIDRQFDRRRRRGFVRTTLPRVCNSVGIVFLIIAIGATGALAASAELRTQLSRLLIEGGREGHLNLSMELFDRPVEVPEGWEGRYYPTYIPEGYEFEKLSTPHYVFYSSGHFRMTFGEYTENDNIGIDFENTEYIETSIGGNPAIVYKSSDISFVIWSNDDRFFVITIPEAISTAIQIAESVKIICQ